METIDIYEMHNTLIEKCSQLRNADFIAKVFSSWQNGKGVLPEYAGMSAESFSSLVSFYFEGMNFKEEAPSGCISDPSRKEERQSLIDLFLEHRNNQDPSELWIAEIIASACLGNDHLWQDTGLWSRKDLSAVLADNFNELFLKNTKDMKWKKFFYKQLCAQEGIYVCRSPSCEVCDDYSVCFGPEE